MFPKQTIFSLVRVHFHVALFMFKGENKSKTFEIFKKFIQGFCRDEEVNICEKKKKEKQTPAWVRCEI